MLQPGIQESDIIVVPGLFHLMLVQERDTPCAVMEDGCPLAGVREVYRTLVAGPYFQHGNRLVDAVIVIAVFDKVNAAVEYVNAIIVVPVPLAKAKPNR